MSTSIINGNKVAIACFGGKALRFGGILPFEFLNYLSSNYKDHCDLYFFIDEHQSWYHEGIKGITTCIDDTVLYLNNLLRNYDKVLFMGTSAGGYAAILFGSLCNVNVISFIPQTILQNPIDKKYKNLKDRINPSLHYIVHGDINGSGPHDISHCENIQQNNVTVIRDNKFDMKRLRDDGTIKIMI